jgi:uncharacterized membrane protein
MPERSHPRRTSDALGERANTAVSSGGEAGPVLGTRMERRRRRSQTAGLGAVLLCLCGTLLIGLASKEPCASGRWADGRQYRTLCYTDIVPLLATEQIAQGNRLPFLDACRPEPGNCDEYPVLTMYIMRAAAWMTPAASEGPSGAASRSYAGFFHVNVAILALAAAAIAIALYLMVGARALFFALAPTLLVYGFVNWDLVAVAFATLATLAYLNRRDVASGVLIGAGAATKLYPALLAVPLVLGRFRERRRVGGVHLVWAAIATWLALNLPFALAGTAGWWEFFRFNGDRPPDWDSLWYIACDRIPGFDLCDRVGVVNILSLALFVLLSIGVWRMRTAREPSFPRWTFGFPLLVLFLLTNKVYSPQYGLWLLPWFALTLPDIRRFAAFEIADVAVFVTRFAFFGQMDPHIGGWVNAVTIVWFELAVLLRAATLVWCLAAWIRRPSPAVPVATSIVDGQRPPVGVPA